MRLRTPHHALMVVAIAACGDDDQPRPDTSADAEVSETTPDTEVDGELTEPDGEVGETADTRETTNPGDVTGQPLEGTTLDGIRVDWDRSLALCNAWSEGASIEDELAHKVHITMTGQARSDLTFDSLANATVLGPTVKTGPFAADKVLPIATSRVARYEVIAGEGYDALGAEIEHDLGVGGVLVESYSVARAADNDDDVQVGEGLEVTFLWAPAPGETFHALQPCAVPDDYSTAIAVLPASNATMHATFTRYYGTYDSELSAGSYPVRLIASQVALSDDPWRVFQANGEWAQTYAAQHHNWGETTRIDFTRDLGAYHTVFKPLQDGDMITAGAIKTVQFADVGRGEEGSVVITRLGSSGAESSITMTTARQWRRVDSDYLGRQVEACDGRVIGAVGYGDHVAQIATCADAAGPQGKRLVAVVPVQWNAAPAEVGNPQDKITATSSGWSVAIGASTMHIDPVDDGAFIIDVRDAAGESVANSYAEPYPLSPYIGWDVPVESQSDEVYVHIDRRWAAQGVGESQVYAVASMTMTWPDNAYVVDAWDQLDYTNTHHNWNDTIEATTADGHVLHWTIVYDFESQLGLVQTVWVTDAEGTEVLAPTVVTAITAP